MANTEFVNIHEALADPEKGPGLQTTLDLLGICGHLVPVRGADAVLSGLITAFLHIAHLAGAHGEAVRCLRQAIAQLEDPHLLEKSGPAQAAARAARDDCAGRA